MPEPLLAADGRRMSRDSIFHDRRPSVDSRRSSLSTGADRESWGSFMTGLAASRMDILPVDDDENDMHDKDDYGKNGRRVIVNLEEAAALNLRILNAGDGIAPKKPLIIPKVQPVELLFFRMMFTHLRENSPPPLPGQDPDDHIPLRDFQRAFERLFYVLGDQTGFDARAYDENGNGFVGWGEFCYVFRKRSIVCRLSFCERLHMTFEDPDSSRLGEIIWLLLLFTIVVSSVCFVLSTVPDFQTIPDDGSPPQVKPIFHEIEIVCLFIFIVEYVTRLGTCWAVRHEVFDRAKLLDLAISYEQILTPSALMRTFEFFFHPANLIDLAAIVPGLIGLFTTLEGGGFVVLRLIRLTRILRAFKSPQFRQPVVVIARTLMSSTTALNVLAFNILIGIVISGSLMYLTEGGDKWDPEARRYFRVIDETWDEASGEWIKVRQASPFQSIPHAFWWAMATVTTVGYGDMYPTTSAGYLVASLTMVFSLVVMALPVGVIGGTFTKVWQEVETEKQKENDALNKERFYITSAIQSIDPARLGKNVLIEVWNERWSSDGHPSGTAFEMPMHGSPQRPPAAEFMGEVLLQPPDLDLHPHLSRRKELRLELQRNDEIVSRKVTGHINVRYEWIPHRAQELEETVSFGSKSTRTGTRIRRSSVNAPGFIPELRGKLTITLLSADNLINLNWNAGSTSNPFCTVSCYPDSPQVGSHPFPACWQCPTAQGTLAPTWNCSERFNFKWTYRDPAEVDSTASIGASMQDPPDISQAEAQVSVHVATLRSKLRGLKLSALKKRACLSGAGSAALEAIDDAADPHRAAADLIIQLLGKVGSDPELDAVFTPPPLPDSLPHPIGEDRGSPPSVEKALVHLTKTMAEMKSDMAQMKAQMRLLSDRGPSLSPIRSVRRGGSDEKREPLRELARDHLHADSFLSRESLQIPGWLQGTLSGSVGGEDA